MNNSPLAVRSSALDSVTLDDLLDGLERLRGEQPDVGDSDGLTDVLVVRARTQIVDIRACGEELDQT